MRALSDVARHARVIPMFYPMVNADGELHVPTGGIPGTGATGKDLGGEPRP